MASARSDFFRAINGSPTRWAKVSPGTLPRVGDVYVEEIEGELHVAAVVATKPLLALTSYKENGVRIVRGGTLARATPYRYTGSR
jgi:hypothetical protein